MHFSCLVLLVFSQTLFLLPPALELVKPVLPTDLYVALKARLSAQQEKLLKCFWGYISMLASLAVKYFISLKLLVFSYRRHHHVRLAVFTVCCFGMRQAVSFLSPASLKAATQLPSYPNVPFRL